MKFKTLFFLFNIVIFVSFAFVFLMPIPVLGLESALSFWSQNWIVALIFVALLGALDAYFLVHWALFSLLEREDWPGLQRLLETELSRKGTLGLQKTKILLNACLIAQKPSRISELRQIYLAQKSGVLGPLALTFGLPLVLEGKSTEIEAFFGSLPLGKVPTGERPWVQWVRAFGFLLAQNAESARPLLEQGFGKKTHPVLKLLSLYLMENLRAGDPLLAQRIDAEKARLAALMTPKEWQKSLDTLKERIVLVLFMDKLIQEAREWLGQPGPVDASPAT